MQNPKPINRIFTKIAVSTMVIVSSIQVALADPAADERAAIAMYSAGRYSEAAGLFKSMAGSNGSANACYYLGLCLTQLRQPALATDYFFQAFEKNADASPPNPQMSKLCQQALANVAWCRLLSLKNDQPQSIKVQSRDGKVLLAGQLSWGSKGLVGKLDSDIEVHWGRFVAPGLVSSEVKGGFVGNNDGMRDTHIGGGVNIVVNKKLQVYQSSGDMEVDFKKLQDENKKAPRVVVCFTQARNKDGSTDVYLIAYPGTNLAR